MTAIEGKWRFKDTLELSNFADATVDFTTEGESYQYLAVDDAVGLVYSNVEQTNSRPVCDPMTGWQYGEAYRTVDFGAEAQAVTEVFYRWLLANAQPVAPGGGGVEIGYRGTVLARLSGGQTATLACAGKLMEGDITVTAAP